MVSVRINYLIIYRQLTALSLQVIQVKRAVLDDLFQPVEDTLHINDTPTVLPSVCCMMVPSEWYNSIIQRKREKEEERE